MTNLTEENKQETPEIKKQLDKVSRFADKNQRLSFRRKGERMKILLQASMDLLSQQNATDNTLNLMFETAVWDNTECDGGALLLDIKQALISQ